MEIRKLPGVFTSLTFLLLIVSLTTQASAQGIVLQIEGQPVAMTSHQGVTNTPDGSVTPVSFTVPARPAHPELATWIQSTLAGQVVTRSVGLYSVDSVGNTNLGRLYSGSVLSQIVFPALDTRTLTSVDISFTFNPNRSEQSDWVKSPTAPKPIKISSKDFIVEHNIGLTQDIQVYAVSSVTWQSNRGQVIISPVTFGIQASPDALQVALDLLAQFARGRLLPGSIIVNIINPYVKGLMLQDSVELLNLTLVSYNPVPGGFVMTFQPGHIRYTPR